VIALRGLFRPESRFPGVASVAAVTLYSILFLHAESQGAVMGLLAGALVGLPLLARLDWTQRVGASFAHHPRLAHGAVLAGVLIVLAAFHDQHFPLLMLATVLLYIVVCLGLNVQFGYAGVLNFAGSAFFGVGAYTSAVLATKTALPHLLVVATGGVLAALIGSLLILPLLRTRGHYAALITIAFSLLFKTLIEVNDALGGPQGLKVPGLNLFGWNLNEGLAIGGLELSFYANYVALALALAAAAFVLTRRLERSWIGLSFDAVSLDETASATFGIDVARWKILAFTIGNFLAGVAGAVYGMMTGFAHPNNYTFGDSLILVSIILLGGLGNPWGLAVAAAIVVVLPEKLQMIQEYRFLLFSGLVILILLFRPGGLLPRQVRDYAPGWRPR
jgi:ABC-type branched-subunit amino acid transport system permease subunit